MRRACAIMAPSRLYRAVAATAVHKATLVNEVRTSAVQALQMHVSYYYRSIFARHTRNCSSSACLITLLAVCPGGQTPVSTCQQGCSQGYTCTASNVCCPQVTQSRELVVIVHCHRCSTAVTCPSGVGAVGACINGQCGTGFTCNLQTNLCCQITSPTGSRKILSTCSATYTYAKQLALQCNAATVNRQLAPA